MGTLLALALACWSLTFLAAGFAIWQANRVLGAACGELERFMWDVEVARIVFSPTADMQSKEGNCRTSEQRASRER